jgi:hydrophobe/amphiphile efflux-3 (HAE3) family protein
MKQFTRKILKNRWIIIASVIVLTLFFGYQTRFISINSDIVSSLPDDDPAALLFKNIGNQFGGNEMGMIVLESDNVFKNDLLKHVKQITDSLKITHGVSTVTSLTNILDIKSTEEGIEIGKLVDDYNLPESQSQLDSLKSYVFSKEMYKGAIVSEDGTATVIMFTLLPDADKQAVAKEIKEKTEALNLPEIIYFGGLPFMVNDVSDLIISDIVWLLPIVFIVIALILYFSFKSLRGVLMPLLTAGIAVIWTIGIMVTAGHELTIILNIVPIILLAVGSAYTIHVINSFNVSKTTDINQTIIKALGYVIIPVVLAAVTTAIGFVSFVLGAYLTMIRDFGIFTAIGVMVSLILAIFFVPALTSVFSKNDNKKTADLTEKKTILSHVILQPLSNLLFKHPKYIFSIWGILMVISIVGMFLIKTSTNMADYFKKDNPTRISEDLMQKKFGGSFPVFVVFDGDVQSPEVLKTMIKTEQFMKQDPNISITQSVADLIEQMNDAMLEGKKIPDDRTKIEQLWFLLDGQDVMPQLVSEDLDRGIIQSKFASVENKEIEAFTKKMQQFIEENSNENCKIELTGMPSVYVRLNDSLIKSQFSSLLIALVLVVLIVGLIFRSFSKGIYATIPIIATILVLFGFMGFTGIPLDIATVLVGSIALGIGIDYSIHFISGFNAHLKENGDAEKAIEKTLLSSGKAIIINVTSVAAGFLVLLFSQLVPLQNFGLLVAISMFGSGLGSLTLLPVILILANRKRKIIAN